MAALSLAIVTPWWNRHDLLPDYLAAVEDANPDELLIIDNGSDPVIPDAAIRLPENVGFSPACNLGLQTAKSDAVLFLNNDIEMVSPGWCDILRSTVDSGVLVGARIRYDAHGDVDGRPYPYLDGWCICGLTEDLLDLGGWDETYAEPSYYGDNDLCFRARWQGFQLEGVPVALRHKEAGDKPRAETERAAKANQLVYAQRVRELMGAHV